MIFICLPRQVKQIYRGPPQINPRGTPFVQGLHARHLLQIHPHSDLLTSLLGEKEEKPGETEKHDGRQTKSGHSMVKNNVLQGWWRAYGCNMQNSSQTPELSQFFHSLRRFQMLQYRKRQHLSWPDAEESCVSFPRARGCWNDIFPLKDFFRRACEIAQQPSLNLLRPRDHFLSFAWPI